MKTSDVQLIKPIMEKSLAAGIFEPNTMGTNNIIANLNCVSKPSPELQEFSKADKHINKSQGITSNKSRICINLRSLNYILGETPKVRMPRTDQLKGYNSHLSSFDSTQFFYGIKLAQESKNIAIFIIMEKLSHIQGYQWV